MPPIEVWGPAVWRLFHTLAERVNEQLYPVIANQLFAQIVSICKVLPCPDCATDATHFLSKIKINEYKTKTDFKNLLYLFHNYVNAKKRKPLFNYANINVYANYKLVPVCNHFFNVFNTKGNMKLIAETFQRNLIQNNFKKWLVANIGAFIPPQPVSPEVIIEEPVQEVIIEEPVSEVIIEEPDQEVIEEPDQEFIIEEPDQEVIEEPVQEVIIKEPVSEVIEEPDQEVIEEPDQEVIEEQVIEEPDQEIIEEPDQEVIEE